MALYGWFSKTQLKRYRNMGQKESLKVYLNEDGIEVMVTCVSTEKEHPYKWPDLVYVDRLTKFVKCME